METDAAVVPSRRVRVYGRPFDADSSALRDFLSRSVVQFDWFPVDTGGVVPGDRVDPSRLPLVVFPDGTELVAPTLREVADRLGWIHAPRRQEYDLSIYGAGPAGLSAAVYAAGDGRGDRVRACTHGPTVRRARVRALESNGAGAARADFLRSNRGRTRSAWCGRRRMPGPRP